MNRRPPPPGLVAAAEQDYHGMQAKLGDLVPAVRALLAGRSSEVEVLSDVWLTLLCNPTRSAALLGATAIVQLAKRPENLPAPRLPGDGTGAGVLDGDVRAAVWQGCVHARWSSGPLRQLADRLATSVRRPGAVAVTLDPPTLRRLLLTLGWQLSELRRWLDRLVTAGLLTQVEPGDAEHWGRYALSIPPNPVAGKPATEPGS